MSEIEGVQQKFPVSRLVFEVTNDAPEIKLSQYNVVIFPVSVSIVYILKQYRSSAQIVALFRGVPFIPVTTGRLLVQAEAEY